MTNLQILMAARATIANEANWIRGRRNDGDGAHCALGALDVHCDSDAHPVTSILAAALTTEEKAKKDRRYGSYSPCASGLVANFNNASSHSEVLALFDRAIERQRLIDGLQSAPSVKSRVRERA